VVFYLHTTLCAYHSVRCKWSSVCTQHCAHIIPYVASGLLLAHNTVLISFRTLRVVFYLHTTLCAYHSVRCKWSSVCTQHCAHIIPYVASGLLLAHSTVLISFRTLRVAFCLHTALCACHSVRYEWPSVCTQHCAHIIPYVASGLLLAHNTVLISFRTLRVAFCLHTALCACHSVRYEWPSVCTQHCAHIIHFFRAKSKFPAVLKFNSYPLSIHCCSFVIISTALTCIVL